MIARSEAVMREFGGRVEAADFRDPSVFEDDGDQVVNFAGKLIARATWKIHRQGNQ